MEKNYITNGIVGGVAPTLAIATSLTNVKTTNAINFKIDGQVYSLAATNPLAPIQTTISIPTASTGSIDRRERDS